MDLDYEKEGREFLAELDAGKFSIERIPNNAADYQDKEDRDVAAFDTYLQSESFKTLNDEASR